MTIDELNTITDSGEIGDFILVCEAKQVKALSRIADTIAERGNVRLVLLAGPSSSGKTTTAKRLITQLQKRVKFIRSRTTEKFGKTIRSLPATSIFNRFNSLTRRGTNG